jgi:hypothetical protein
LWGYTNPQIAKSKRYSSQWRIRVNPELFLDLAPAVLWLRTNRENVDHRLENIDIEKEILALPNNNHVLNQLGDMEEVLARYDVVKLKHKEWITTLLLNKLQSRAILAHFQHLRGRLVRERPIDLSRFHELYTASPNGLYSCN